MDKAKEKNKIFDSDDFFHWILISAFIEEQQKKWDCLRDCNASWRDYFNSELTKFFEPLFKYEIPKYLLKNGKKLYRARQIKEADQSKLKVNIDKVTEEFYKIFLSDEEIKQLDKMNNGDGLCFTLEHLFMMKAYNMEDFTDEQKKSVYKLIRQNSSRRVYGFSEIDSRVPPKEYRKNGRLSNKSDEYLYLAFNRATAIHEMRPSIGQRYSIAEFKVNKDLIVADLTGKKLDLKHPNYDLMFLANKISEPNTEGKDEFYFITQFMAHMIQKQGFDGILYRSSLKKGENNIMLFDEKNVDFTISEIVSIDNVSIDYSTVLPFDKQQLAKFSENSN